MPQREMEHRPPFLAPIQLEMHFSIPAPLAQQNPSFVFPLSRSQCEFPKREADVYETRNVHVLDPQLKYVDCYISVFVGGGVERVKLGGVRLR